MRWIRIRMRNGGVPKKVEQINDHLFIDTYKSINIKIGVNVIWRWMIAKWVWDEKDKLAKVEGSVRSLT